MTDTIKRWRFGRDLVVVIITFAVLLLYVFPFLWVVLTSIRPEELLFTDTFTLFTPEISFENYQRLLDSDFPTFIVNSLIVCIPATIISVVLSLLAAYSFSRRRFRYRAALLIVVIFSQLFPWVALITPMYSIFFNLGLVNTLQGLILAYIAITIPFSIYMLLGYFDSVPRELDEAAALDGCSTIGTLWRVVLPVAWPGVVATAIYAFAQCWNEYVFALTLATDTRLKTVQLGLAAFFGEYTAEWGLVMTASVIATLPTLIIFMFLQRRLVAGLAAGAVKY
jgi:ABC-type glycerol-3-phosphate transport system permease component